MAARRRKSKPKRARDAGPEQRWLESWTDVHVAFQKGEQLPPPPLPAKAKDLLSFVRRYTPHGDLTPDRYAAFCQVSGHYLLHLGRYGEETYLIAGRMLLALVSWEEALPEMFDMIQTKISGSIDFDKEPLHLLSYASPSMFPMREEDYDRVGRRWLERWDETIAEMAPLVDMRFPEGPHGEGGLISFERWSENPPSEYAMFRHPVVIKDFESGYRGAFCTTVRVGSEEVERCDFRFATILEAKQSPGFKECDLRWTEWNWLPRSLKNCDLAGASINLKSSHGIQADFSGSLARAYIAKASLNGFIGSDVSGCEFNGCVINCTIDAESFRGTVFDECEFRENTTLRGDLEGCRFVAPFCDPSGPGLLANDLTGAAIERLELWRTGQSLWDDALYETKPAIGKASKKKDILAHMRISELRLMRAQIIESSLSESSVRISGDNSSWSDCALKNMDLDQQLSDNSFGPRYRSAESSFFQASFREVTFEQCSMEEALFAFATFEGVRFERCKMRGAKFENATFNKVVFKDCKLQLADFENAIFRDCSFIGCDIDNATFERIVVDLLRFKGTATGSACITFDSIDVLHADGMAATATFAALRNGSVIQKADLRGLVFQDEDLVDFNFHQADLRDAVFASCDMRGAALTLCDLRGAVLDGSDLTRAVLFEVQMNDKSSCRGTNFSYANLQGAQLAGADLGDADFRGANLQGASIVGANLQGTSFNETDLSRTELIEEELSESDLQGARGYKRAGILPRRKERLSEPRSKRKRR